MSSSFCPSCLFLHPIRSADLWVITHYFTCFSGFHISNGGPIRFLNIKQDRLWILSWFRTGEIIVFIRENPLSHSAVLTASVSATCFSLTSPPLSGMVLFSLKSLKSCFTVEWLHSCLNSSSPMSTGTGVGQTQQHRVCACLHLRSMREDAPSSENMDWSFIGSGFISINERDGFSNNALTKRSENNAEWTWWCIDGDPN